MNKKINYIDRKTSDNLSKIYDKENVNILSNQEYLQRPRILFESEWIFISSNLSYIAKDLTIKLSETEANRLELKFLLRTDEEFSGLLDDYMLTIQPNQLFQFQIQEIEKGLYNIKYYYAIGAIAPSFGSILPIYIKYFIISNNKLRYEQ